MVRVAALALAVLAAAARAEDFDPLAKFAAGVAPFKNLSSNIETAVTNGGTPKSRILNGTKPTTVLADALNAKRAAVQATVAQSIAAKINASAVATQTVANLRAAQAQKQQIIQDKFSDVSTELADKRAALAAQFNGSTNADTVKMAAALDGLLKAAGEKVDALAADESWFAKLKNYKTRFAGPAPDLSAWDFSDLGTASSANVDQTTNGQVTPADETAASDYGQRLVAGARYGGAAPNEGSSDVEAAAGDDADAADEPSVVGTPSVRQIAARQRMEAAAAAEAASEGTTPAGEPLGDTDLALTAWLAAKPADGADEATLQAWVESLPEDAVAMEAAEDEAEAEAEAAVDADGAPFDGAVGASEFYATVAPDGSTDGMEEERVIGVPDYVAGPGVAIADIDEADTNDQKKFVALRLLGVKRNLALDALGATEGGTLKSALAYILVKLKWGDGVDLIFGGEAASPQAVGAAARRRSLLATAVDAGRKLLATSTTPLLVWPGDNTRTTGTYTGYVVEPPDQALCAGGGWVIESVNAVISVRSQATAGTVAANFPKSLYNFFGGVSGDSYGDPRCVFIPGSNVFVVASYRFNGANSWISMSVSPAVTTTAPNVAVWKTYMIDSRGIGVLAGCKASTPCIGDYPMLGFNDNSLWLSTNAFYKSGTSYYWAGVQLFGLSLTAVVNRVASPYIFTAGRTDIFTLHPMKKAGTGATGDVMHFLSTYDATRLYKLTISTTSRLASNLPPATGTPVVITTGIRIASPPTVRQANNVQVDGGDTRILSVGFANGRLYAVCNTAATWSGVTRNSVAYYIVTAATNSMVYAGVYGSSAWHVYGAAIAPSLSNANNAAFVAFATGSTTLQFGSLFGKITVGSGVTSASYLSSTGNNVYLKGFTSPTRTGDYSDACVDPATGQFWGASEQGQSVGVTSYNNWGTAIWNSLL